MTVMLPLSSGSDTHDSIDFDYTPKFYSDLSQFTKNSPWPSYRLRVTPTRSQNVKTGHLLHQGEVGVHKF